jgi:hypothetical protein
MVAVLIGAALLGIVGALVAIPVAAALQLLTQEVLFPTLDDAWSAASLFAHDAVFRPRDAATPPRPEVRHVAWRMRLLLNDGAPKMPLAPLWLPVSTR